MINKLLLNIIAVIIGAIFVIGSWITTGILDFGFFRFFSVAVFVVVVLLLIWDQWAWKWAFIQKVPRVTRDISGTWETRLESLWIDPDTGESPAPKTVYIIVRQTSSQATITLISNESKSKSSIARVIREDASWIVHYVYSNEPQVELRERSSIHHGSGVLSIVGNPAKRMAGSYWTDRNSKGKLSLVRRVKFAAEDFDDARDLFSHV